MPVVRAVSSNASRPSSSDRRPCTSPNRATMTAPTAAAGVGLKKPK